MKMRKYVFLLCALLGVLAASCACAEDIEVGDATLAKALAKAKFYTDADADGFKGTAITATASETKITLSGTTAATAIKGIDLSGVTELASVTDAAEWEKLKVFSGLVRIDLSNTDIVNHVYNGNEGSGARGNYKGNVADTKVSLQHIIQSDFTKTVTSLKYVIAQNCAGLENLGITSDKIETLDLTGCSKLQEFWGTGLLRDGTEIDKATGLKKLILAGTGLDTLGLAGITTTDIDLSECTALEKFTASLTYRDSKFYYGGKFPAHLTVTDIKDGGEYKFQAVFSEDIKANITAVKGIRKNGTEETASYADGVAKFKNHPVKITYTATETYTTKSGGTGSTTVNVTVSVVDNSTWDFSITTTSLPNGLINSAYTAALTLSKDADIDDKDVAWSLSSGSLPTGLSLDVSSGKITGTPTAAGTSSFTVKAAVGDLSATKALSITIAEGGTVANEPYGATGGGTTYTYDPANPGANDAKADQLQDLSSATGSSGSGTEAEAFTEEVAETGLDSTDVVAALVSALGEQGSIILVPMDTVSQDDTRSAEDKAAAASSAIASHTVTSGRTLSFAYVLRPMRPRYTGVHTFHLPLAPKMKTGDWLFWVPNAKTRTTTQTVNLAEAMTAGTAVFIEETQKVSTDVVPETRLVSVAAFLSADQDYEPVILTETTQSDTPTSNNGSGGCDTLWGTGVGLGGLALLLTALLPLVKRSR